MEFTKSNDKQDKTVYLGLFLFAEWDRSQPEDYLLADLEFCLRNQRQLYGGKKQRISAQIRPGGGKGTPEFIPRHVALDPANGYNVDDSLKVHIKFTTKGVWVNNDGSA